MNGPEFGQKPVIDKIRLPAKRGWLKPFGIIPWKIHYYLVGKRDDNDIVSADDPARHKLTPNTGGGYSMSLYLHHSIPKEYKHILAYHELKEAETAYINRSNPQKAHPKAVLPTDDYARQFLNPEQFEEYKKWEKDLLEKTKSAKI